MRPHLVALLVAACLTVSVRAQWDDLLGRRILGVEVAGEAARTTRARDVGIPINARLSRRLLRATVQRLVASGRWADVQLEVIPEGEGARIVAHLVPKLVLARVDIVGNEVMDDEAILRELQIGEGVEIERTRLDRLRRELSELYAQRGYEAMRARFELRDTDDPARKVLRIQLSEGEPTRIVAVVFEGQPPPRGSRVRGLLDVDVGDILDRRQLDESVQRAERRLRRDGWLEARLGPVHLRRRPGGVVLVIGSHVGPRYGVEILHPEPLTRSLVYESLGLGQERLDRGFERALAERVADLYRRRGFSDARVRVRRIHGRDRTRARLVLAIRAGPQLRVVARAFPGARHFSHAFLEDQLGSFLDEALGIGGILDPVDPDTIERLVAGRRRRERAAPPPFDTDPLHIWYPEAYERAVEHVRDLYEADGFLEARVGPARLEPVGPRRAAVVVPVVEGPRSLIHAVVLEGNRALTSREVLLAAGLERGQPFSYLGLERAKAAIVQAYQERGFYYASVEASVRFSSDRTRAQLLLHVNERFEVRVGAVRVEGNELTTESLIRRVIPLHRGTILRPSTLRDTQERLLALGVFTSVSVAPQDAELPARVKPVVISVVERKTQYLDFRAGVSTAQGARFGLEYGYRNLFGTAISATLSAQLGYQFFFLDSEIEKRFLALSLADRLERRIAIRLGFPFIGLSDVRTSLAAIHMRENERNFGLLKNSVDLTFVWRPRRQISISFSGDVENNNVDVLGQESYEEILRQVAGDTRLRNLLRVPEGRSTLAAIGTTVSYDRRDSPFVPTRGFFASATAEWARTLRSERIERAGELRRFFSHHLRMTLTASGYLPLGSRDRFVFAAQLKLGRVVHLEDRSETYPNRSFFVGGVNTLRGYLQDALVPQDLADEIERNPSLFGNVNGLIQGGDTFMVLRGELRFPIAGELRGGAFVDLGNSWIEPGQLNPFELRPTAGLGIRIGTPVGPIALDYGIKLLRREFLGEGFGAFHFSIGLF